MYCSTCGKIVQENLNYCNNCGARNEKSPLIVGNSSAKPFAVAAMLIGGGGLFGFFPVIRELLRSSLDQAAVILLLLAYLLTVFLMFAVLVGHIWKNSGDIKIRKRNNADDYAPPRSFRGVNTAQLEEARQPAISVTENTTRTLDHVPFRNG